MLEAVVLSMLLVVSVCFVVEMFIVKPSGVDILVGMIPTMPSGAVFVAVSVIGATVMPHNLYLHSAAVLTRPLNRRDHAAMNKAQSYFALDTILSLSLSFLVNLAILVMAAASFFEQDIVVETLQDAYRMLDTLFGDAAKYIFGISLLFSGQSSTITGTLAGETVMEGFLDMRWKPWKIRLFTRSMALLPACIAVLIAGNEGTYAALVASQVVLSIQLPFALIPLVRIVGSSILKRFRMKLFGMIMAWSLSLVILSMNFWLLFDSISGVFSLDNTGVMVVLVILLICLGIGMILLLVLISFPYFSPFPEEIKLDGFWRAGSTERIPDSIN